MARFPGTHWDYRNPQSQKCAPAPLVQLAVELGGNGCVIRNGYAIHMWGAQHEHFDWLSSAKPLLSTLLFFAVAERRIASVDARLIDAGWDLKEKDRTMTFAHLANMVSGYARPEAPGAAFAYNDFAINLYQKTLFDRVFQEAPEAAAAKRLGAIGLEDGLRFRPSNRRLSATVRDFCRIGWFWLNRGRWCGRQLLPESFFRDYCRPHVPPDLPHTAKADTADYLNIGTFGGGSDHFTNFGPGIYGFNWWFNRGVWPAAPPDAFMSIGAGGNCAVMIPSRQLVLACARGKWGPLTPGDPEAPTNRHIRLLMESCR